MVGLKMHGMHGMQSKGKKRSAVRGAQASCQDKARAGPGLVKGRREKGTGRKGSGERLKSKQCKGRGDCWQRVHQGADCTTTLCRSPSHRPAYQQAQSGIGCTAGRRTQAAQPLKGKLCELRWRLPNDSHAACPAGCCNYAVPLPRGSSRGRPSWTARPALPAAPLQTPANNNRRHRPRRKMRGSWLEERAKVRGEELGQTVLLCTG